MRLLLDTHALIWWLAGDAALSRAADAAIADPGNDIFVSAVTAFEISNKFRLGKLPEAALLANDFVAQVAAEGFSPLPISLAHGVRAGGLLFSHRDPFDRLLIAQALTEAMTLVSNERLFDETAVPRLW